jgi:signal transduction histidine kinase
MASEVMPSPWRLAVSPGARQAPALMASTRTQSYWLSGLSVVLMLVALAMALQMRQRAALLARMQADFVAHVSHQLKTPVSLLSAVAETMALDRVRSPDKLAQCVDIVRLETTRLSSLIERILEFSRASDGVRRFELEAIRLGPLVRETVDSFRTALAPTGYRIEVDETGTAPVVAADPVALEQALVNLLDNAIKYSGDSRLVTVRIGTAGADATIDVVDRGIGIGPVEQERIFERFYRGSGATWHRQGFGLGLAIAQELVAGQRGAIDVQSAPGQGSTFRIRIPILHGAEAPARRLELTAGWLRWRPWRTRAGDPQPKEVA